MAASCWVSPLSEATMYIKRRCHPQAEYSTHQPLAGLSTTVTTLPDTESGMLPTRFRLLLAGWLLWSSPLDMQPDMQWLSGRCGSCS
jgi:hypothetical protein